MTQREAFGALCEALEYDAEHLTPSASRLIGKVASELVKANADRDSILYLPTAWQRMWGQGELPTLTVTAISTHWPALWKLYQQHLRARENAQRVREETGTGVDVGSFLTPEKRQENLERIRALLDALISPMPSDASASVSGRLEPPMGGERLGE